MKEFDLIEAFFKEKGHQRRDVQIGIGDDAAVLSVPAGQSLVVTTDTLIDGVHFPHNTPGRAVASKAVAVNLSDLAAMGAEPAWLSLSLSIPQVDENWLNGFSLGLQELTDYYSVQLIGGDTVRGPLSITVTAQGFVPQNQALTRSGAKPGDWIYVTGTLGDAGLGLDMMQGRMDVAARHKNYLSNRLNCPTPRVLAGTMLRRIATSCIDISDGLIQDLRHILKASDVSAIIQVDKLPFSQAMQDAVVNEQAIRYALTSGDDYELLFTVPEEQKSNLQHALSTTSEPVTCIGQITGGQDKLELRRGKEKVSYEMLGYQHFGD
ncbi:thiamine-phosphate kinase [Lacimicrobium alkaliphilum]|uniref:Thiamine-monophosphate kinase n=1 Tax=Lacimicrobium alkaliphilum TaxID=1526571 RepID=A0A0U2RPC1_9ALTE|nr:thiamine-phosphate kinase [Lacimicrobium alkaliphilum]ALS99210.1 thiamine-monophosphate kinase [Lacimicrobium alkaliphilum]